MVLYMNHRIFVVGVCEMVKHSLPTPLSAQRLNRKWTFVPSPNRSGRSRHGIPIADVTVQHRLDELPIVRRGHSDRAFTSPATGS